MKKSTAAVICIVVALTCSIVTCYCTMFAMAGGSTVTEDSADGWKSYGIIREIDGKIGETSIHNVDENIQQTMDDYAVKGYLAGLGDPYAEWMTKDEFDAFIKESEGNYVGIGVLVQFDSAVNAVRVVRVYDHSPAGEAGIMVRDVFSEVDGTKAEGLSLDGVKDLVTGEEGSYVHLVMLRDGKPVEMTCERRDLVVTRIDSRMVTDNIGYISISEFNGDADTAFAKAYTAMKEQGMEALVVDLRDNPGGQETTVVNIAGYFMGKAPVIIEEDKYGNRNTNSSRIDSIVDVPTVVLVNGNSASASELLTANLKDLGLATIIGTCTYGKGTVQNYQYLSDGSVLKLTAYRYLTGQGTGVQDVGVEPDILVEPEENISLDYLLRTSEKDNQFLKALEVLNEKLK